MILKSIKLSNIRSYIDETVIFPEGSVLLSGDIGSGKSTVLLAIEFALFGVKRKQLSGSSLLRNGANNGFVELSFSLEGKDYIVKRFLKRGKDSIKQDTGYIIKDGIKKECTAVELKTEVIDLIGYPRESIAKTSDLVYRYTVFTPQEEMKQILTEDPEVRLTTLRRVFGVDKYKNIKENCALCIKDIKSRVSIYSAKTEYLNDKKKAREEIVLLLDKASVKVSELTPQIEQAKSDLAAKKKDISDVEAQLKKLIELKNELKLRENNTAMLTEQHLRNDNEIKRVNAEIVIAEGQAKLARELDEANVQKELGAKISELSSTEKGLRELMSKVNALKAKVEHSNETKDKISRLNHCPTCYQEVSGLHKQSIHSREDELIQKHTVACSEYLNEAQKSESLLKAISLEIESLRKHESEIRIRKIKLENINDKVRQRANLEQAQEKLRVKIDDNNLKIESVKQALLNLAAVEHDYESAKKEYESILVKERQLSIELFGYKKEKESLDRQVSLLNSEITYMEDLNKKSIQLKQLLIWLEDYFINVMSVIEKHVMFKVHSQFNELFQEWFDVLIEDEAINVKLSDSFSPVVQQNGYESEIENLSGGEKTSCALAYRLALNKVVNDLIGSIKTKDILILDEPTDGFSTEQLDKVRDVIDQLSLKQIIIVSHESKIESFVDNVIRVHKEEHVSHVLG